MRPAAAREQFCVVRELPDCSQRVLPGRLLAGAHWREQPRRAVPLQQEPPLAASQQAVRRQAVER